MSNPPNREEYWRLNGDSLSRMSFRHGTVLLVALFFILGVGITPVSADEVLIVGAAENFPPYYYVDYTGEPVGFNVDIMRAVAEEMSLNISFCSGPWNEVRSGLEEDRIDLISGMFYSEDRDKVINFSQPFITVSHAIYVREGSDIGGPDDLVGREIIVEEGDIMHDYALGLDDSNTIIPVEGSSDALFLLASGEYDAALISKLHVAYLVNTYGVTGVTTAGPPIESREFCIAASSNASSYLPAINEGLAIIKENGKYDEIYDTWFGVYEEREFIDMLLQVVFFVLLPVIILLAAALAWSVSLRRKLSRTSGELADELALQKRVKAKLQESRDKYQVLFNSLNEGVFLCEYESDGGTGSEDMCRIIEVNDTACRRLGYTRDELLGKNILEISRMGSPDCDGFIAKLATGEKDLSYYAGHVKKDGSVFPVHVRTRILDLDGKEYMLHLAWDITKERESQRIETDALVKIEENLTQLATLNDEIRNPLMVISGVLDLEFENADEMILEQVAVIDEIINRLDQGWVESSKIREFLRKHLEMYEDEC